MTRYFFDLFNAVGWLTDPEGAELADVGQAYDWALTAVRDLIGSEIVEGNTINLAHYIVVRDESRNEVLTLYFRDAVQFCDEAQHSAQIL